MILTVLACRYNRWGHSAGQDMVGTARQQLGTSLCQNRRGRSPRSEAHECHMNPLHFKNRSSWHHVIAYYAMCESTARITYINLYVYYAMHWCLFVHVICTQTTCLCSIIPSLWLSPICAIKLFLNYWLLDEQYPFPDKAWKSSVHRFSLETNCLTILDPNPWAEPRQTVLRGSHQRTRRTLWEISATAEHWKWPKRRLRKMSLHNILHFCSNLSKPEIMVVVVPCYPPFSSNKFNKDHADPWWWG